VCVPGDKRHALARGKREQVVVAGIDGVKLRWFHGIRHNLRKLAENTDEPTGVVRRHATADLRVCQRSLHLIEQRRADDELERARQRQLDQTSRCASSGDQSGDENVGVEDRPHALRAPCLMLCLDSDAERLILVKVAGRPDALEEIEPEIPSKRFLDHVAIATAAASCLHTHGTEDALVQGDRRSRFRHIGIIASICRSACWGEGPPAYASVPRRPRLEPVWSTRPRARAESSPRQPPDDRAGHRASRPKTFDISDRDRCIGYTPFARSLERQANGRIIASVSFGFWNGRRVQTDPYPARLTQDQNRSMRSSSVLSVVSAVTGWLSLGFSAFTALLEGSRTWIGVFLAAAGFFGIVGLTLAAWGISRERSGVGTTFALLGVILGLGLLVMAASWTELEYGR
jgi:hypothetical protein